MRENFNASLYDIGEFSTAVAIASFVIGTLLFGLCASDAGGDNLIIFGFVYVCLAAFLNLLILINLLWRFATMPAYRGYLKVKILIVLANVPIALAYFLALAYVLPFL